ncbi:MAG: DUF58 domain-containing protein [Oscillospiraceae bacterium]|nr:DUF58 domain-containing protein [Oscillospiraceae bacterium]
MREFRVFYSVLVIIMMIMCFVYQSRLMPLLLLILVLCPVLSLIVMLVNFAAIRLKVAPGELVAEKSEECILEIRLQNHFLFPVSPIRIIGDFQSLHDNEIGFSKKILMTDIQPLGSAEMQIPFKLPFRGEYNVRIYEICVYDLLKLFRLRRKLDVCARIIILPREKAPSDGGRETETDIESPASIITAHRSNMFNSLREYHEGDSVRNIHWKLSAKQDEIIVKQMEQSVNNSAVIFCDFSGNFGDNFMNKRMLDAVLETSLAVTKKILLDGNSVINCWQGAYGSEKYEAAEFSHYSYLHGVFTVLPQEPSKKRFDELISLFSPEIKEHHNIYIITPDLNETLLKKLEETGLSMRSGIMIITFDAVKAGEDMVNFISEKTKIKLIEINDCESVFSL